MSKLIVKLIFFFQAEDGIRGYDVTGVQTCALPISLDLFSGKELWSDDIPYTAQATPMTYQSPSGKQTLIATVPVYNSTRGVGMRTLPVEEEDPLGGYIIAYRLAE